MPTFTHAGQRLSLRGLRRGQAQHRAAAGTAVAEPHARAAGAGPGRPRQPGDHLRPARDTATRTARATCGATRCRSSRARWWRCSTTWSSTRRWSAAPRSARTRPSRWRRSRPPRLRGMVVEMPVLDNALLGLRDRLHAPADLADVRRADHATDRGGAAGASHACSATTPTSVLDWVSREPGSFGRAAAGALLRANGAAQGGAQDVRARRRSCWATRATGSTPSRTRRCSPRSCPTGA